MVFYQLDPEVREVPLEEIEAGVLTAGYVSSGELAGCADRLGILPETVEECRRANPMFRTGAEVYPEYTFSELRIVNRDNEDDWIGVCLKKDLLLVVDIIDYDGSTREGFFKAIRRTPAAMKPERMLSVFVEALIADGIGSVENMRNTMADMEESVVTGKADEDFNIRLLELKKKLLKRYNYYDQILDVIATLEENENGVLEEANLFGLSSLTAKVTRLRNDVESLSDAADHLQDAYSAFLDMKMNHSMKILTVITTAFFPLTIIVGWYGMNFQSMPEFTWKYGYVYVILLSVAVVAALVILARKRKWF